jgi:hypothetical protein
MTTFFRTALYYRNLPTWERALRVLAGAAMFVLPLPLFVTAPFALMAAATGFVGFCPACYFAGRRLEKR